MSTVYIIIEKGEKGERVVASFPTLESAQNNLNSAIPQEENTCVGYVFEEESSNDGRIRSVVVGLDSHKMQTVSYEIKEVEI